MTSGQRFGKEVPTFVFFTWDTSCRKLPGCRRSAYPSYIYGWIGRWWWEGGVEGLANKPKSRRPTKADDAYTSHLEEVIAMD